MTERLRILFTEGASLSARQTLYPLGPHHDIDVLDPDPLCQCRFSSYVRRFVRSPSFAQHPEEFLRFLAKLVRTRAYDVLLPTHEQVYLLSRFRDAFTPHVGLALPDFAALERLQNKAHFSRLLAELNLPQPATIILGSRAELTDSPPFPLYLKLAHSTAGGGVFYIKSADALQNRIAELQRSNRVTSQAEILLQQPARGVLSTAQAVFEAGKLIGIHCFEARRLGVGGMSTARTSADHPGVREDVERLGNYLAWHGAFFIDYFFDREAGRPEYIEANPRIGETVNAMLSGINLAQLLVQISRGKSPPRAPLGRCGIRTHNLLMILMSMAYEGGNRSEMLREISRCRRAVELYEDSEDELTRPRHDPLSRLPRFWIISQLLAWPVRSKHIVAKTVENYSLPESAIERIKSLPLNYLDGSL